MPSLHEGGRSEGLAASGAAGRYDAGDLGPGGDMMASEQISSVMSWLQAGLSVMAASGISDGSDAGPETRGRNSRQSPVGSGEFGFA